MLNRRALVAAAAAAVPVPGLDWAVDAALLSRLIPAINAEFGLTPAQLDQLSPHKREQIQKAVAMVGSVLIGKFITRDLVLKAVRALGMALSGEVRDHVLFFCWGQGGNGKGQSEGLKE